MSDVFFAPAGALRGEVDGARRTSRSRIARRCSARCPTGRCGSRTTCMRRTRRRRSTPCARSGAEVSVDASGDVVVRGVGLGGARAPDAPIDVGNAGTLMRLLPGWLAAQEGRTFALDGDASIRRRPVDRIAEPLARMGAVIEATDGRFPPFVVRGTALRGVTYVLPVASAQVKSCVLIAGLGAEGTTTVTEPAPSRDHTERMLAGAGVEVTRSGADVSLSRAQRARGAEPHGPRRPLVGGVHHRRRGARPRLAGDRPRRRRQLDADRLPADPRADGRRRRRARSRRSRRPARRSRRPSRSPTSRWSPARLQATVVEADEVPLAIDELPLVALLGCFAEGETVVRGAHELRVKESDRIAGVVDGLRGLGATIEATEDGFVVDGGGGVGCAAARSTRTATTAWRCSARSPAWPRARASASSGWRPPRCRTRASCGTSASCAEGGELRPLPPLSGSGRLRKARSTMNAMHVAQRMTADEYLALPDDGIPERSSSRVRSS